MSKTLTIAVSGLNATDNPGPGIPIIRSLKESLLFSSKIIGLCYENLEPGIFMNELVDQCYQMPYPLYGAKTYLQRLQRIQEKAHIDVLIPCLDAELPVYIELERELQSMGIKMFIPTSSQFEIRQKFELPKLAELIGISVPETQIINNFNEFNSATKEYPLFVKGKFYEAHLVTTDNDATQQYYQMEAKWGLPIILQKYEQGTEFNVIGCGDGNGNVIANVAMRKVYVTDKGKAWSGITIENEKLLYISERFCKYTKWRGGFELELIKGIDNELYLIEINPRIPAWVYLATGAGQNIPEQTILLALGETPQKCEKYEIGKMFVRYSYDMIIDQSEFSNFSLKKERL